MGPARPAVLGQVLIERVGEVVSAVDVAPSEGLGKRSFTDVLVRQGAEDILRAIVTLQNFNLVHPLLGRGDAHSQGCYGGNKHFHRCVVRGGRQRRQAQESLLSIDNSLIGNERRATISILLSAEQSDMVENFFAASDVRCAPCARARKFCFSHTSLAHTVLPDKIASR
jgi:hypothetical protein